MLVGDAADNCIQLTSVRSLGKRLHDTKTVGFVYLSMKETLSKVFFHLTVSSPRTAMVVSNSCVRTVVTLRQSRSELNTDI